MREAVGRRGGGGQEGGEERGGERQVRGAVVRVQRGGPEGEGVGIEGRPRWGEEEAVLFGL